jgi:DNA-binding transcriptional LysR family regulator
MNQLWSSLHWLTVLEKQGSYTGAAKQLGVSTAAVSQRISELERVAAIPLVQRTTRVVRLTEAGMHLVEDTRASFDQISESFQQLRNQAEVPRGMLRVTSPSAFARQKVVPLLAEFLRKYPQLRLELDMSDRFRSLTTDGFDLAIRHTDAPPDNYVAWSLCPTRSLLVASRAYLRQRPKPTQPQELSQHDCLCYPRTQGMQIWTFEHHKRPGPDKRVTVPVSGLLSVNNSEALRDAALTGLGIAVLPDFTAHKAIASGKLVRLLPEWKPMGPFAEHVYAMRPYSAQVPRGVTLFIAFLREAFAQDHV